MRNRGVSSPMPFLLIPRSLLRGGFILVKHRPVIPLGLRPVVDQHIGRVSTAGTYGILVCNGDGLFLKMSDGGVKIEEHIEISLQCRLKRNGTVTSKVTVPFRLSRHWSEISMCSSILTPPSLILRNSPSPLHTKIP